MLRYLLGTLGHIGSSDRRCTDPLHVVHFEDGDFVAVLRFPVIDSNQMCVWIRSISGTPCSSIIKIPLTSGHITFCVSQVEREEPLLLSVSRADSEYATRLRRDDV